TLVVTIAYVSAVCDEARRRQVLDGCDSRRYAFDIVYEGVQQYYGFTLGMFAAARSQLAACDDAGCRRLVARLSHAEVARLLTDGSIVQAPGKALPAADGRYPGRFLLGDFSVTHNVRNCNVHISHCWRHHLTSFVRLLSINRSIDRTIRYDAAVGHRRS